MTLPVHPNIVLAAMEGRLNQADIKKLFDGKWIPEPTSGCWIWTGSEAAKGYGRMTVGGKAHRAHRLSYEIYKEQIPEGMCVCHTCDNPSCVNPDHLFVGTNLDNVKDKIKKGRGRGAVGIINARAKLTEEQVLAIRADKRRYPAIARDYGISRFSVSEIRRRKTWPHIGG